MAFLDDEVTEQSENTETVEETTNQEVSTLEETVVDEQKDKNKKQKAKAKKPSKIKATFGELKKVSWTPFGKVLKQTAVVLSVTLVFLIVVMGIDQLLYFLFNLIQP